MTIRLQGAQPVVQPDGTMSQAFRLWSVEVTNSLLIVGTGSPEAVIEAPQYSLYLDETDPANPVQWRKMLPEIAGDRKAGWAAL